MLCISHDLYFAVSCERSSISFGAACSFLFYPYHLRLQKLPTATLTSCKGRFQTFQCHSEMLQYRVQIFSHSFHSSLRSSCSRFLPIAWIKPYPPRCIASAMLMFSPNIHLFVAPHHKSSPAANCVSILGTAWLPLLGGCNADAGYA